MIHCISLKLYHVALLIGIQFHITIMVALSNATNVSSVSFD